jgi:hypothetical protein
VAGFVVGIEMLANVQVFGVLCVLWAGKKKGTHVEVAFFTYTEHFNSTHRTDTCVKHKRTTRSLFRFFGTILAGGGGTWFLCGNSAGDKPGGRSGGGRRRRRNAHHVA